MNKVIASKITEAICTYDGKKTGYFMRYYNRKMGIPMLNITRMKLILRRMNMRVYAK